MKDQETVEKFIELRSQGLSHDRIAAQIGVSKGTLINWSRKHQHIIANLSAIEWEAFLERVRGSKQARVQTIVEQIQRLEAELGKREPASMTTSQIQGMLEQLYRRLDRECGSIQFTAGVELSRDDDTREAVQTWNP
jgi:hypothetical protein